MVTQTTYDAKGLVTRVDRPDGSYATTTYTAIDSASRSAVKTAIEEGIKRGADPAAKVLYIDGMAAGLNCKTFMRGVEDRKLRSPDPFHKLEEIYVRYGDGQFCHYVVGRDF